MKRGELLLACEDLVKSYNPLVTTVDAHAAEVLGSLTKVCIGGSARLPTHSPGRGGGWAGFATLLSPPRPTTGRAVETTTDDSLHYRGRCPLHLVALPRQPLCRCVTSSAPGCTSNLHVVVAAFGSGAAHLSEVNCLTVLTARWLPRMPTPTRCF